MLKNISARQRQKISCNDQVAINLWDQLVFTIVYFRLDNAIELRADD